uniref:Peptidase_M3 domain-containing protein n=2 Tax=Bursaphelenchus xylophilus TaxID=6326 RepID=A0A1I7SLY1_BURXY
MKFCEQSARCENGYVKFDAEKEKRLMDLIEHRQKLARLTGFRSFADRAQQHTILGGYDQAVQFLELVTKKLKPILDEELEDVYKVAVDNKLISSRSELSHADVEMASRMKQQALYKQYGDLSRFLRFGGVLKGFGDVCHDLYGINLEISRPEEHEIWDGDVVKIQVEKGHDFLGTIYIDAERRKSKNIGDCHFTVRCSKLLEDGTNQKPIVVLSLSFFDGNSRKMGLEDLLESVTIHPQHAENMFHELGHAIHSMLGATRYQHTAGTRCPTDFAEVPSNLMEFFFSDPRVLKRFCEDLKGSLFTNEYAKAMHSSLNIYPTHFHTQQLLLALFDLQLHHNDSSSPMRLYHELHQNLFPRLILPADYAYHQGFTHIVTYGAKYYSYTIAKACASQIWQKHFEKDPFSRISGGHWAGVQARGGERPSAELLELALGTKLSVEDLAESFRMYCQELRSIT